MRGILIKSLVILFILTTLISQVLAKTCDISEKIINKNGDLVIGATVYFSANNDFKAI